MTEEYFINVYNERYPFERYIYKTPAKINSLFDDLFFTELFIPSTEIKPMLNPDGSLMRFTEVPTDEIFIKVKGTFGEARLSFFDFADHIREEIRYSLIMDFGQCEWESLYVRDDDEEEEELKEVLESQRTLIEKKYGVCNIKEHVSIYTNKEEPTMTEKLVKNVKLIHERVIPLDILITSPFDLQEFNRSCAEEAGFSAAPT